MLSTPKFRIWSKNERKMFFPNWIKFFSGRGSPPILQVDHYVSAYGYSVSAKFDFTDVPAEYHEIMLRLILIGRCHVTPLATEEPTPNPPAKKWWHRFIPNKKLTEPQ